MKHLFLTLLLVVAYTFSKAQGLEPGTSLPKAVFYKTDGTAFSTEQIPSGKKALLMFFDATCEHCQRVGAHFSKRTKELAGANIYLVTQDEPQSIDYYVNKFAKPLTALKNVTILRDKDNIFVPLFHPRQYPALYLFGTDKKLVFFSSNEKDAGKFVTLMK